MSHNMARIRTTDLLWLEQMLEQEEGPRLRVARVTYSKARPEAEAACARILEIVKQELWTRSVENGLPGERENE